MQDDMNTTTEAGLEQSAAVTHEVLEQAGAASTKAFDTTVADMKNGMTKAASTFAASQSKYKEGVTKTMKTAEDVVAFGQGNLEAVIKSGQIWSTGWQDLSKQMASSMQASYEDAMTAFKAMTTVKSLKEAVDLQVGLARSTLEKSVAETSKYTDASMKLAEQAIAPISGRMTLAVENFSKTA
jgi:phasin family protein